MTFGLSNVRFDSANVTDYPKLCGEMSTPPWLDRATFGPARRRRYYARRMRQLDRLDATRENPGIAVRSQHRRERLRTLLVVALCAAVLVGFGALFPGVLPLSPLHALGGGATWSAATDRGPYRFLAHQPGRPHVPVSYNPCRPIHVVLNPAGGPHDSEALVRQAMDVAGGISGFRFVYDGRTSLRPHWHHVQDRFNASPPVLVSFATTSEVPELAGDVAGIGGSAVGASTGSRAYYTSGGVTLDADAFRDILSRPGGRAEAEGVVQHEFGHLLGLAHVPERDQLMYPHGSSITTYQGGDRQGLEILGAGSCS